MVNLWHAIEYEWGIHMNPSNNVKTHDQLDAFQDRLAELNVDSTVLQADSVEDELNRRIKSPAVGCSLEAIGTSLPASVEDEPTLADLKEASMGITPAQLGVVSQGSIIVTPNEQLHGPASLYPSTHIAVLRATDLVPNTGSALEILSEKFESGINDAVFITGPSSTGDMGEFVVGVHGPAEVQVLIVE